jgi:hypothetical protein
MLIGASGVADTPKEAAETAKSIEGIYLLYRSDNADGMPIRKLAITAREGKGFSVVGVDEAWSGEGRIEGNTGYYNWVFASGERGKTTLTINADGTLTGKVEGEIFPWTYLARRSGATQAVPAAARVWEYKIVEHPGHYPGDIDKVFNDLGAQGWEYCGAEHAEHRVEGESIRPVTVSIFKRSKAKAAVHPPSNQGGLESAQPDLQSRFK